MSLDVNEMSSKTAVSDLQSDVQQLKTDFAVQQAVQAGSEATQAATHAGTWSTMLTGGLALIVGMFVALAVVSVRSN
jgi:outer membrane murein-binding lipoprotein Lpp